MAWLNFPFDGKTKLGSVGTNEVLNARFRFAAISIWLATMPVSSTATRARTNPFPRSPLAAVWSAWI